MPQAPYGIHDFRVGDVITAVSAADSGNNGTYTVTAVGDGFLGVTPAPPIETADDAEVPYTFTVQRNYSGTYTVDGVADGFVVLHGSNFGGSTLLDTPAVITVLANTPVTEYTDWTTLKGNDRTEVWVNIVAPNGLVKDNGGQSACTVEFEISIERLDPETSLPTGQVEIVLGSISGSVTDEQADTIEHATAWTGPARIRMRRTSQHDFDFTGTVVDEIKWNDLYSVTPVSKQHFGNKTTIHTITQATSRSTAVKTRQLNCISSRLIPTFDGANLSGAFDDTGLHVSGSISATSKLVDIMAAVSVDPKIGNRNIATDIDLAQIYGIQQQLDAWHPEAGQFNYTLDTDNFSFEETVMAIANAGFCTAYRQNGKIRFALDRPQENSIALFTHRNKKPSAESITRSFFADGDYDGVSFQYTDPDTGSAETIILPLDGGYTKLKQFEIPGIRSFAQAWFRANREYYKTKGQRITIETSTTLDARSLLPNARVDIVDNTRFQAYDGEVVGQSGLTLTLSQRVEFVPGEPHSMVLMRRDGTLQSIPVRPGVSDRQVVIDYQPNEAIVTTPGDAGVRTIYSIASDSDRQKMAYLINEIELTDGTYATLRAVNYSDDYYQADFAEVPAAAEVIN